MATPIQLVFDTHDPDAEARFWADALHYQLQPPPGDFATWDDFLAVNFMGAINASNAVVPFLWEQRSGSIVNISSTAAFPLPLYSMFTLPHDSPPPPIAGSWSGSRTSGTASG